MRTRGVFWAVVFATLLTALAPGAQTTTTGGDQVFAPFVSRLRAAAAGALVDLTWRPSPDVTATLHVYRSSAEITAASFELAERIATLRGDTTAYRDIPDAPGAFFYAVLLETADGGLYETFIPFRNQTSRAALVEREPTVEELAAVVTELTATTADQAIVVRFVASRPGRDLLVFRGEQPLLSSIDLLSAAAPRTVSSSERTLADPVPPGEFYYAVVDAELFKLGRVDLVPGSNTTAAPVRVLPPRIAIATPAVATATAASAPAPAAAPAQPPPAARRQAPLPFLQIAEGVAIDAGALSTDPVLNVLPVVILESAARDIRLTSQTLAILEQLLPGETAAAAQAAAAPSVVEVLPADASISSGREDYALQAVVHQDLLEGDLAGAAQKFRDYLSIRRSPATEARAHFYLGQALYFQGLLREGILEFLLAEELYPDATAWIDATLAALARDATARARPD
jgi:hypothetical protein